MKNGRRFPLACSKPLLVARHSNYHIPIHCSSHATRTTIRPSHPSLFADMSQAKLQTTVEAMMKSLELNYARPAQVKMHMCMAGCYSDKNSSPEQIQGCASRCSTKLEQFQATINQEMNFFQQRLQRCAESCQDSIRDELTPEAQNDEALMKRLENKMTKCVDKCADDMIYNGVGKLQARLEAAGAKTLE